MLNPFRTYHSITRLVAMVIFVASALPFIGHACMMAEGHDMPMMKQCCCDDAHGLHEGMEMAERDCEESKESSEAHHSTTLHDDCCLTEFQASSFDAAARVNKTSPEELISYTLVFLHVQRIFEPTLQKTAGKLQDTGPPVAPLPPLHLLHSRFLI